MFTDLTDDKVLSSGIKNDNLEAYKILYHRYKKKLFRFSLRYLKESDDAEEIVQLVFISLWEHRKTLDVTLSLKSYIYKTAVNNIYSFLRKKAVRQNYIEQEMQNPEKSGNQTYEHIYYKDLEKIIGIIVSSLPPQQQKIFHLSRFEGLSHEEIANKLDLSVRTVENQIYRVKKVIKHLLEENTLN